MQFQRNDKKRSAQPASGRGGLQRICSRQKKHPQRHCPGLLLANPAHAGKRTPSTASGCGVRDHPRICGEKYSSSSSNTCMVGSPPHMRGKGRHCLWAVPLLRITPAYAGKSCGDEAACHGSWDHPRACGEKSIWARGSVRKLGSPPRMRGKGFLPQLRRRVEGITPAHAGKRRCASACTSSCWDHPRACGEKHVPALRIT